MKILIYVFTHITMDPNLVVLLFGVVLIHSLPISHSQYNTQKWKSNQLLCINVRPNRRGKIEGGLGARI